MMTRDQHLSRYPIAPYRKGFELRDRSGERISYHRTVSGALRKRRDLLEQDVEERQTA